MCRMCEDRLLEDHGQGPLVEVFEKVDGKCPRCKKFPAGGGCDGEFVGLCYHCFNELSELGNVCLVCLELQ